MTDMQTSSMIYFALSAFILFLCIVGYFVLLRLPITKFYMAQSQVCPVTFLFDTASPFCLVSASPRVTPPQTNAEWVLGCAEELGQAASEEGLNQ
jgi:hypothetical protein